MGMFGWSYPPGCNSVPGDEPIGPCLCCGKDAEQEPEKGGCICPECPTCNAVGDPICYKTHGLFYSAEQIIGQKEFQDFIKQESEADAALNFYIEKEVEIDGQC